MAGWIIIQSERGEPKLVGGEEKKWPRRFKDNSVEKNLDCDLIL